jgi:peroxiredoxin
MGGRDFSEAGANEALDVGNAAPDFTLRRTFDESVSLGDLLAHGPVVLVFYVFDYGEF